MGAGGDVDEVILLLGVEGVGAGKGIKRGVNLGEIPRVAGEVR